MDELRASDESAFVPEQVEAIVKKIVETQLTDIAYEDEKVEHWIDSICSECLKELAVLNKPFKYLGVLVFKWPAEKQTKDQNQLYCIVTVFGCQL